MLHMNCHHHHHHHHQLLSVLFIVVTLATFSEGSRYSFATPADLAKVVAPLVIVGIIFIVMLVLLAIFQYQKKGTLCSCLCCREFCNKHRRMRTPSGDTQCACITKGTVKPGTMCEACKKWKASSGGLLDHCDATGDGASSPEVRICRCTINNGCGSVLCKMNRMSELALKQNSGEPDGKSTAAKYLTSENFLPSSGDNPEECNCPCTWGEQTESPTCGSLNIAFDGEKLNLGAASEQDHGDCSPKVEGQAQKVLPPCGQNCNCQHED